MRGLPLCLYDHLCQMYACMHVYKHIICVYIYVTYVYKGAADVNETHVH